MPESGTSFYVSRPDQLLSLRSAFLKFMPYTFNVLYLSQQVSVSPSFTNESIFLIFTDFSAGFSAPRPTEVSAVTLVDAKGSHFVELL